MRAFCWFVGLILLALAAMAVFSYPVWRLLEPHFGFPFHRVADRIGMLALALGFVLTARRLRLADRASLGYGVPPRAFVREALLGFGLGVLSMALIVALMVLLDLRRWRGQAPGAEVLLHTAGSGLLRGVAVALIEETFLRGAMFSGIARESGARLAVILTALVYAVTHFVGRYHIAAEDVTWRSGLDLLGGTLQSLGHPLAIADAFLCLAAVGVVLGLVRTLTGHIGACLGLHAAWVWVIAFLRETSMPNPDAPLSFLLSRFDGVVGWLVLLWTILIGWLLYGFYARRGQRDRAAPA
jgi:membrane protease YdiL (CAAX protease family)